MSADGLAPDERGVRRGVRQLPVVLTPDELVHVAQEMARLAAAKEDAEAEVDAVLAEMKEKVSAAKGRVASLDAGYKVKARVYREGRVDRDVAVTTRVDWKARTKTVTRDDTGDVIERGPCSSEEWEACGEWVVKGKIKALVAPDGSHMRELALSPEERQAPLPLAEPEDDGDGEEEGDPEPGAATPGTTRVWVHGAAWRHLDHADAERLEKPDPKGPTVVWREDGEWFRADVPTVVLSQVETYARKAEVRSFTQPTRPTLADLRAQTPEEETRLKPKGRKVLPPKE